MYAADTMENRRAVRRFFADACGDVLVVDDDPAFGRYLRTALESRGHDVDWAGSIHDALASLYARHYDLVIIDITLHDGSGLQFLRNATDDGLLADSAAIILTGYTFEEPSDIRVFRKPLQIEPFLDRLADIVACTKRRAASLRLQPPVAARGVAPDWRRPRKIVNVELILYTRRDSETCRRALETIHRVLAKYDRAQVSLIVRDLGQYPADGAEDSVVTTPTLVKRGPGPRTWIIGNLDQDDLLVDLLEMSGIDPVKGQQSAVAVVRRARRTAAS